MAAASLFKLTAYKDEYEVARLMTDPEAMAEARRVGGPGAKAAWRLHPPALRAPGHEPQGPGSSDRNLTRLEAAVS